MRVRLPAATDAGSGPAGPGGPATAKHAADPPGAAAADGRSRLAGPDPVTPEGSDPGER
jgi:hypothetical protein